MRRFLMAVGTTAALFSLTPAGFAATAPRGAPESFADLVDQVMPAVVNISTSQGGQPPQSLPGGGRNATSLGSGFIIDPSGYVVTNGHVIENADRITINLNSGEEYAATLEGLDPETDLAVLKIEADARFPAVRFGDSDRTRVGDWVVAIGQPFGLGGSVSAGIVSARNRDIDTGLYDDYLQTDAAINRGNSGGPLFDMSGRVIGVNTIIYSQTGGSVGVGFAVPANMAARVVQQLIEFGETQRDYLGVLLEDVSPQDQARLGLQSTRGALIVGVPSMSGPAGQAGLKTDDVVIRFNNQDIITSRDLTRAVADTDVGSSVPVVIIRNGRRESLQVTLARRETMTAMRNGTIEMGGMTLQSPNEEMRTLYGLGESVEGVIITHVDPRSPLAQSLRPGDVILEVGWDKVSDAETVERQLNRLRAARSGPVQILVQREDKLFYEHITP